MSFFTGNVSKENRVSPAENNASNAKVDLQALYDKYVRELNMLRKSVATLGSAPAVLSKLNEILEVTGDRQPERLVAKTVNSEQKVTVNQSTFYKDIIAEQKKGAAQSSDAPTKDVSGTLGMNKS